MTRPVPVANVQRVPSTSSRAQKVSRSPSIVFEPPDNGVSRLNLIADGLQGPSVGQSTESSSRAKHGSSISFAALHRQASPRVELIELPKQLPRCTEETSTFDLPVAEAGVNTTSLVSAAFGVVVPESELQPDEAKQTQSAMRATARKQ